MFNIAITTLKFTLLVGLYTFLFVVLRTIYLDMAVERRAFAPRLIGLKGAAARGSNFPLSGESIVIGREVDGGLSLPDPYMSNRHVRLFTEGNGYAIEDLGSTNGAYLNGRRLTDVEKLKSGDRIRLGETIFQYME